MSKDRSDFDKLRILVIEDFKEARALLRAMLSDLGVQQIFEANDGREGLEFFDIADDMINVVICDWNMPRMTGSELLTQIRSVNQDIPFLMITGRCDIDSVREAKHLGVSGYIRKPFSQQQLEAKLRIIQDRMADA